MEKLHEKQNRFGTLRSTHVVLLQVRMVLLYSVIQDGHYNPFTCVAQLPRSFGIQVTVVAVVLRKEGANKESNYLRDT